MWSISDCPPTLLPVKLPSLLLRCCILLLLALHARAAGTFSVVPLTGDADSGIAADAAFTHAINVFDAANVKINGAIFTGSGTGANPTTNDYTTTGFNNGFTGFDALANDGISGGVGGLMTNFLYNGSRQLIQISLNLIPFCQLSRGKREVV